ncbi:MAG TPA: hypothetical protein DEA26_09380 [Oceanospirillales bacterium]|nr:hypothetical protein [Oceanospirillales bacterium]
MVGKSGINVDGTAEVEQIMTQLLCGVFTEARPLAAALRQHLARFSFSGPALLLLTVPPDGARRVLELTEVLRPWRSHQLLLTDDKGRGIAQLSVGHRSGQHQSSGGFMLRFIQLLYQCPAPAIHRQGNVLYLTAVTQNTDLQLFARAPLPAYSHAFGAVPQLPGICG